MITDTGTTTRPTVRWPLVLGLGALALVRPLVRVVESELGVSTGPALPIALTVLVTGAWVVVVVAARVARPVLTLVLAGAAYAVLATILSGILSPLLLGELQGPLATPFALVPMLAVNLVWGLVAGLLALGAQRVLAGRAADR